MAKMALFSQLVLMPVVKACVSFSCVSGGTACSGSGVGCGGVVGQILTTARKAAPSLMNLSVTNNV